MNKYTGFTTIDPLHQYPSPFMGMGNNPVVLTDPLGAAVGGGGGNNVGGDEWVEAAMQDYMYNQIDASTNTFDTDYNFLRYGSTGYHGGGGVPGYQTPNMDRYEAQQQIEAAIAMNQIETGIANLIMLNMMGMDEPEVTYFTFTDKGVPNGKNGEAGGDIPDWVLNAISYTIPVAYSFEISGAAETGGASSASPWGGILITRGPDAWNYKNFTSAGLGGGWISASAMGVVYRYYYVGDINHFSMKTFERWGNNLSISGDIGYAVGVNVSWVENRDYSGEYLIGVGMGGGIGVGPTIISGQYTRQFNHIYW